MRKEKEAVGGMETDDDEKFVQENPRASPSEHPDKEMNDAETSGDETETAVDINKEVITDLILTDENINKDEDKRKMGTPKGKPEFRGNGKVLQEGKKLWSRIPMSVPF